MMQLLSPDMQDLGDKLLVIVNNDTQAKEGRDSKCCQACEKKGQPFMPARERVKLVRSLACVDAAIESIDKAWSSALGQMVLLPQSHGVMIESG